MRSRSAASGRCSIDLDPQGSASHALGLESVDGEGASALFRRSGGFRVQAVAPPAPVQLGVVCADPRLAEEEAAVLRDPSRGARLAKSLEAQRGLWEIAVLDTPPALGALTGVALRAADAVVVPVAADYLAVETLRATLEGIRAVERDRGSRYRPLAVLPTMVQMRRPGSRAAAALVRERFGDLVLPRRHPVQRALRQLGARGRAGRGTGPVVEAGAGVSRCRARSAGPARRAAGQAQGRRQGLRAGRHALGAADPAPRPRPRLELRHAPVA